MKINLTRKIMLLSTLPLVLVIIVSSTISSIMLGSNTIDEIEKQLSLATYAVEKETGQMSASNTKMETVDELLDDFKEKNNIDITIFEGETRLFSTVPNAVGTKMDNEILKSIQTGQPYFSKDANVNGEKYYAYYHPIIKDGEYVGSFFAGEPSERVDKMIINNMAKMSFITMSIGIASIILSVLVAKRIVKKIKRLGKTMNSLAENDLSIKHEKYSIEHDEIEELCNSTINFSNQLNNVIGRIKNSASELKTIASDLNKATEHTAATSNEISKAVEEVANGAVSQAEETTKAAHKISKMAEELDAIRSNVNDLHDISKSMNATKDKALSTLLNLLKINEETTNYVNATSKQVNITSKSVDSIQDVIEAIKDIANKTKLLSLNASIEAAKAGEQGRGFAVVAENIRVLAEQSAKSSDTIREILTDLKKNYNLATEFVNNTANNMILQNEKLSETQNVFVALENDVEGTVERIVTINEKVKYLNTEIGVMVDIIANLSAISEENSASTEQTMAAIEEMNSVMLQVHERAQTVDQSADSLLNEINIFTTIEN